MLLDEKIHKAIELFSAIGAIDPRRVPWQGLELPYQLAEAASLQYYIEKLEPAPSVALQLAAHCQHLRRYAYPRSAFPEGRAGYLAWRSDASRHSAAEAAELLGSIAFAPDVILQVTLIVSKKDRAHNPDVQTMQDALGLSFLRLDAATFCAKHTEDEVQRILQRTWLKTSPKARELAHGEPFAQPVQAWLKRIRS